MKSSLIPFDLPQALMTKGSLYAMTMTWSTPLAFRASFCSMNVGMCFSEQVGVKAPGTATMTTFLFLSSAGPCRQPFRYHLREGAIGLYAYLCLRRT